MLYPQILVSTIMMVIVVGCTTTPEVSSPPVDTQALQQEAKQVIAGYGKQLKGTMQTAFKQAGPTAALIACKASSAWIDHKANSNSDWEVGRTALKYRNPLNAPDDWELKVLEAFEERKAQGEDPSQIAYGEVVNEHGVKSYRFMKAIPTAQKPCTVCHGESIKPEITALLDQHYPNDKARGFKAGDIRGAFSLHKVLNSKPAL
jgi:hypothetical protein